LESANDVLYFITDKIVELQGFFLNVANTIARIILLIAILTAALNYALTGTGLKENIIKIGKAFVFFSIVIFFYPRIISWITEITFTLAKESTYVGRLYNEIQQTKNEMREVAEEKRNNLNWTASAFILTEPKYNSGPKKMLDGIINTRKATLNGKDYSYSTVAPAVALESVLLVAEGIFFYSKNFDLKRPFAIFSGLICGFFVIVVGCFCVLEYLIAFIEFMFVSSVGVILFPLSLWEGTKFVAEGYVKAMLGFFVKLLFSAICIFFMLWVFITIADEYTQYSFVGQAEQIIPLFFSSLLIFYLCKSAPALAQSLLSGSPSLTGAGAIGMVASTVMAVSRLSHIAGAGAGAGMAGPQIPSTTAAISSGSGGASIVNQTPPPFSITQAGYASLPAPQQERLAIEDRAAEDLTRSLSYDNRPLIEGPGGAATVVPVPVSYMPNNNVQQALSFGGYGSEIRAIPNSVYTGEKQGKARQDRSNNEKPSGPSVTYQVLG